MLSTYRRDHVLNDVTMPAPTIVRRAISLEEAALAFLASRT